MSELVLVILSAFIIDAFLGDPHNPLHPVRIIGAGISAGVKLHKKISPGSPLFSLVYGVLLSVFIIALTYCATKAVIELAMGADFRLGFAAQVLLCYFIIAAKALKVESMKVHRGVVSGDIDAARKNLSYIVGRDTQSLTFPQIITATVETVAENLSDGVIAPLFFVLIGGVPLGMAYKAVNTLDSMIGYRNKECEYLGKFAARLDDVANFIPARLSALLMLLSTPLTGGDGGGALRVFWRDRYKHGSPNSAQTEAVCAGALGLQLGGDSYYHGTLVHKPTIGDRVREPLPEHIIAANRMVFATAILAILSMVIFVSLRSFFHV